LTEPATGPIRKRFRSWRRLPLSFQLILIGIIVGVTWLLTARLSADRVAEKQRDLNNLRDQLHQAEVSGARVLTDVMTMAAAHRGHLMTGGPRYLEVYEQARRAFGIDIGGLTAVMARDARVRVDAERLIALVAGWDRDIVRALGEQVPGGWTARRNDLATDSLILGVAMTDEFRAIHTRMMRALREDVIRLEAESETEAALDEWESFLLRAAAVAIFALLLTMLLRLVSQSLQQVVRSAQALDAGRYEEARLPNAHRAPNEEMASLARTFDRLARSIEQREGQLQDDIEQLKELERLKADFVSTVSHELRTPLTSMRGALGLLLSGAGGELSPKGRDLLRIALTNTDRLIRLINDILDIEKIDAGHVQIRRDRLRLLPIVESTLAGLEGLARDADARLGAERPLRGRMRPLRDGVYTRNRDRAIGAIGDFAQAGDRGESHLALREHGALHFEITEPILLGVERRNNAAQRLRAQLRTQLFAEASQLRGGGRVRRRHQECLSIRLVGAPGGTTPLPELAEGKQRVGVVGMRGNPRGQGGFGLRDASGPGECRGAAKDRIARVRRGREDGVVLRNGLIVATGPRIRAPECNAPLGVVLNAHVKPQRRGCLGEAIRPGMEQAHAKERAGVVAGVDAHNSVVRRKGGRVILTRPCGVSRSQTGREIRACIGERSLLCSEGSRAEEPHENQRCASHQRADQSVERCSLPHWMLSVPRAD
jgi:signal transduction histidine kinase